MAEPTPEVLRWLQERLQEIDNDPPESSVRTLPVDRFAHLKKETREWLEELDKDDIVDWCEGLAAYRKLRATGRFLRRLAITGFAVATAAATFGKDLVSLWNQIF
jgi:hypothetical protein